NLMFALPSRCALQERHRGCSTLTHTHTHTLTLTLTLTLTHARTHARTHTPWIRRLLSGKRAAAPAEVTLLYGSCHPEKTKAVKHCMLLSGDHQRTVLPAL